MKYFLKGRYFYCPPPNHLHPKAPSNRINFKWELADHALNQEDISKQKDKEPIQNIISVTDLIQTNQFF